MPPRQIHVLSRSSAHTCRTWFDIGPAAVGIRGEKLGKNDLVGVSATDRECVTDHRPLRLAIQAEHFAEIVHKTGEHKPARMPILANRLGCLEQMFDLREIRIRIAIVNQGVEVIGCGPNALLTAVEFAVLGFLSYHELECLEFVVLPVNSVTFGLASEANCGTVLRFSPGVTGRNKIVPFFEAFERSGRAGGGESLHEVEPFPSLG